MKILKHGKAMRFCCKGCGCEWIANKEECKKQTKYESCMSIGEEYYCYCPECGFTTTGTEIEALDVHELGGQDAAV